MAAGGRLAVEVEGLGPLSERVVLELDTPLVVLVGETGTGKSFLLRPLSVLLKNLRSTPDARALEGDLASEFGHPRFAVHEGAEGYRLAEDDVKTVILYREGGVVKCDVGKGTRHLGESARLL